MMTKEQYFESVKTAAKEHLAEGCLCRWNEPEWQELLTEMYERFASYTPEQQERLIKSVGPKEPFWDRVVMDAVFAYHMF